MTRSPAPHDPRDDVADMSPESLRALLLDLARAKVALQQRAVLAAIGLSGGDAAR